MKFLGIEVEETRDTAMPYELCLTKNGARLGWYYPRGYSGGRAPEVRAVGDDPEIRAVLERWLRIYLDHQEQARAAYDAKDKAEREARAAARLSAAREALGL